ncbi:MAG: M48 family metalloprotease [Planctomycetes bacterium]|nr:M48 family metalloprotease [Planctomycetota bacterium]
MFVVITGLGIGLLYDPDWALPWFDARVSLIVTPALVVLQAAAGRLLVAAARSRGRYATWEEFVRRLIRSSNAYRVLALPLYGASVWLLHWPRVVADTWHLDGVPFVSLLLTLLPFLLLLGATFLGLHAAESLARGERLPLRDYLSFHVRMSVLLPLVPAFTVFTLFDSLQLSETASTALAVYPFLNWLLLLAVALAFVASAPWFLTTAWGAKPLPESALRTRLELLCDQAGVPRPKFLVWPTRGFGHVNAAVVGIFARNRAVMFTDAMIAAFTPDEIAAVLAHELGHARHRHLAFYFALALGAALFANFADFALQGLAPESARLGGALAFLALLAGGAFGFYSRRFERQADLFAARLVPASLYIATLEKVASLNGNVRKVWFFTHMSIEQRVNYLLEAGVRPDSAGAFERRLRRAVAAGVAFAAFSLGGAAWTVARQVEAAPAGRERIEARRLADRAGAAWDAGDRERAATLLGEAAARDPAWSLAWAEVLYASGRAFEAEAPYRKALDLLPEETDETARVRERLEIIEEMKVRRER